MTATATGTLAAGSSQTFGLAPAETLTLTTLPNVRVVITETVSAVSGSGLGGNASRVHRPELAGTFTYGPYAMGGSVVVEVQSTSGSSVTWLMTSGTFARDSSGNVTGLVGPDGATVTLLPYNDGTRTIFRMPSASWLQLGVSAQGTGKELVNFTQLNTNAEAVARPTLMFVDQGVNPSATGTVDWHSGDFRTYGGGSNANFTANSGFYALEGKTLFTGTAGQTMGKTVGVFGSSLGTGSSHTLSLSIGVQGEVQQTGAGTTTAGCAFYAKTPTISAGAMTTAYGFYAQDVLGAGTNYAVFTNAGRVRFHSNVAVPAGGAATVGIEMSSTASLGVFFGSGAPTLSAAQGSLYMRTDGSSTSTRMYVNTNGSTGWTAVTTAT